MRRGKFDEYSAAHLRRLKYILADIYSGLGRISDELYLVGGLVADLLVRNKLVYLKEYLGTLDIDEEYTWFLKIFWFAISKGDGRIL